MSDMASAAIARRVARLRRQLAGGDELLPAATLLTRLDEAQARLQSEADDAQLLQVALFGGTGVGKSALFNALLGQANASPVSDAQRCFTRQPYVAVRRSERPWVRLPEPLAPTLIDAPWRGLALIDTPDIDGAIDENWQTARALVAHCDVIVYVTTPDRRADFRVHEELRRWAQRKRWLFVLNKADLAAESIEAVRADFDARLADLGFAPGPAVRFVVSALDGERFALARLRTTLLDGRLAQRIESLRRDAMLGAVQYAVDDEVVRPLIELAERVAEEEATLLGRLRQIYRESFAQPVAEHAFRTVLREQAWQYVGERIGWLMALPIWARRRIALLSTAYYLSRLGLRGPSVGGILGAVGSAALAIFRGTLPMRRILSALGPQFRQQLATLAAEARHFLEDYALTGFARGEAAVAAETSETSAAWGGASHDAPAVPVSAVSERVSGAASTDRSMASGGAPQGAAVQVPPNGVGADARELLAGVDRAIRRWTEPPADRALLEQMQADVDNLAQRAAVRAGGGPTNCIANLLPTVVLGHILWRMGLGWWEANYLPWSFYGMAAGLFFASLLPGYLLIALRVRRCTLQPDIERLLERLHDPTVLAGLAAARRALQRVAGDAVRLRGDVTALRRALGPGLPATAEPLPAAQAAEESP